MSRRAAKIDGPGNSSPKKIAAAMVNLVKAAEANKARPSTQVDQTCPTCHSVRKIKPSHVGTEIYCSKACMAEGYKTRLRGKANPNYRGTLGKVCQQCGGQYDHYNKARKFCSRSCYVASIPELVGRLGRSGIDVNQSVVVTALRAVGVSVFITSKIGHGMPDLITGYGGITKLLEVKNPKTAYGRKGFTETQQKWADAWLGEKPVIVRSVEDAFAAIGI